MARKILEFHLGTLYVSDEEIRKHCEWLLSLAFVPPVDVIASFVECQTSVRQELIPLYDYVNLNSIIYSLGRTAYGSVWLIGQNIMIVLNSDSSLYVYNILM